MLEARVDGRLTTLSAVEAVTYVLAALVHAGILVQGYEHFQARIAESIIAIVLVAGAVVMRIRPHLARRAALWSQTFALVLTLVGVLTIVIGVVPRTVPDVIYHLAIILVLVYGLVMARAM